MSKNALYKYNLHLRLADFFSQSYLQKEAKHSNINTIKVFYKEYHLLTENWQMMQESGRELS